METTKRQKHNTWNKLWARKNRDKVNGYHTKWRKKQYEFYRTLKQGKSCVRCNESHPSCLDFHHINPSTKLGLIRRIGLRFNKIEMKKEADKCILICANCHRKEHWIDIS